MTSDRLVDLDWAAEVFYRRLLNKVDDHGLYDARPSVLRASLYPLVLARVRDSDVQRWLAACQKSGLIRLYAVGGKDFLQVLDTRWQVRSEPKYPPPPTSANNCEQLHADAHLDVVVDVVVDGVKAARKARAVRTTKPVVVPLPDGFCVSDRVKTWATSKGHDRLEEHLDYFCRRARMKGYTYVDWDEAFMEAIRKNWAELPALKEKRRLSL